MRFVTSPGRYRAMTALCCSALQRRCFFKGRNSAPRARFFYFADHKPDLAQRVCEGRRKFCVNLRTWSTLAFWTRSPDPHAPDTFARCKLNHQERPRSSGDRRTSSRPVAASARRPGVFRRAQARRRGRRRPRSRRLCVALLRRGRRRSTVDRQLRARFEAAGSAGAVAGASADTAWSMLWSSEDWPTAEAGTRHSK